MDSCDLAGEAAVGCDLGDVLPGVEGEEGVGW